MIQQSVEVPLGDLLSRRMDEVAILADRSYRLLTVGWWGKGVVERKKVIGSEISSKTLYSVQPNDFIISRIDARKGACDVIIPQFEGAVVSNDFPVYRLNADRLLPSYLKWLSKTAWFISLCNRASEGTTNRVRLKEGRFLSKTIPLPPLAEQRRIVARIEELAGRIGHAKELREGANTATWRVVGAQGAAIFRELAQQHPSRPFGDFKPHTTSGPRNWAARYLDSGMRFYRAQDILPDGSLASRDKVFIAPPDGTQGGGARLEPGDLMFVITGATVGRVAVYSSELEPGFVSQHVAICRLPRSQVHPRYAFWAVSNPDGQEQLLGQRYGQGKPGLNLTNIRNLRIPLPPLSDQERVIATLDDFARRIRDLQKQQERCKAELDALLPAILDKAFRGEL